ncbi:hypothetical protein Cgig2_029864 [Carnegiea gigantea]|uniref:non-specific serine/threonine protein kinase n=1 Tax=Carnegiea gigantea TaxID=171969 RepID=A0A9Q1QBY3_9CARY|nr:hypothetical protein Cgig2_029864 [Carnegiea gigantea]
MATSLFSCLYVMLIILTPSNYFHLSSAANTTEYEICRKPFQCGFIKDLSYPFYDGQNRPAYCGYPGFQLDCSKPKPQISVGTSSEKYYLRAVSPSTYAFSVSRADYWDTLCPSILSNTSIDFSLFNYEDVDLNITLYYRCSPTSSKSAMNQFSCTDMDNNTSIGYLMTKNLDPRLNIIPQKTCKAKIFVPAFQSAVLGINITDGASLMAALHNGFGLRWAAENELCSICRGSGGECGYNISTSKFICYCPDYQSYGSKCNGYNQKKMPTIAKIIEIQRKMIMVSLWCIQTNPFNRPTISRVVEMLEGKLESLSCPPIQLLQYPGWSSQTLQL